MKRILTPFTGLANRELPIPRQHLYAIIMLACFSVASITLLPPPGELLTNKPIPVASDDVSVDAELSKQAADTEFVNVPSDSLLDDDGITDDMTASTGELQLMDYVVKDDDNLSYIFNTLNLSPATLQKLLEVDIQNSLVRLKPGQKISFYLDDANVVQKLYIPLDLDKHVVFERKGDGYQSHVEKNGDVTDNTTQDSVATTDEDTQSAADTQTVSTENTKVSKKEAARIAADEKANKKAAEKSKAAEKKETVRPAVRPTRVLRGTISGSFGNSARNAGLSAGHIHQVARLFQGRIDFRRDLKSGDKFKVLFDRNTVAGKAESDARVLAVILTAKGKTYSAFRSASDNQFYDDDGSSLSMTKSGKFMRYPIPSSTKVSSGFNPHRLNPVTGRVMAHNGTDFSVHVGTPIEATGDGVVVKATRHPDMGIYIVLRHTGRYSTVYMHLSKSLVKPGQKIKMGQVIALSGNTGRSTGPHLHYEFHVNNRPVDAMRVDLPMNEPMQNTAKKSLLAKINEYKRMMNAG
ncbi:peptidoglycan DD-metalloendopeptidase family protein [Tolumonas lignilytica]|uniref:peptidoglycan DD-metalloendopeptidase family protein n=1 Tax=Tolumonas lignilytica TaxID=1283284 RepID=UPI000467A941|nr:peptidoglycan DD-metalloendopeptidase family protein [Tolumonas lignilytica]